LVESESEGVAITREKKLARGGADQHRVSGGRPPFQQLLKGAGRKKVSGGKACGGKKEKMKFRLWSA